jgi:hypothetical protein
MDMMVYQFVDYAVTHIEKNIPSRSPQLCTDLRK